MEKQIFRPTARNWLDRVVGPILLLWALFAAAWLLNTSLSIVYVIMLVIITLVLAIDGLTLAQPAGDRSATAVRPAGGRFL